ncbi:MAG: hypothetical protein H5U20_02525 [Rhodobacteraceae bacterium]|nr:hypothetical protein [Paracoccaceae bacterium]
MAEVKRAGRPGDPAEVRHEVARVLRVVAAAGGGNVPLSPAECVAIAGALDAQSEALGMLGQWRMRAVREAIRAADEAERTRRSEERLRPWVLGVWASVLALGVWDALAPLIGWGI